MIHRNTINLEKKIALIGSNNECEKFFLQFRSLLKIEFCLRIGQRYGKYEFVDKYQQLKEILFDETIIDDQHIVVVLCDRYKENIDKFLLNKGLEWGRDYIDSLYIIQYYRKKYCVNLSEKRIWIFGAGYWGKRFYERYNGIYNICGFVSNYEEETIYQGLPVVRPSYIVGQDNCYVFICCDEFKVIADQFLNMGLQGSIQYGFEEMMPKKLFVAIGTCQIMKVAETLCKLDYFNKQYDQEMYFENGYDLLRYADSKRLKEYGEFCDVVFYNIAIANLIELRDYGRIVRKFYKEAVQLHLPFYYFKGQIRQATDIINPYAAKISENEWLWFRGDQEINHMLENGFCEDEIVDTITGENYWTKQEILSGFKRDLKKIEVLDRFSSFPICSFIEENYKTTQLFLDGTHFSMPLCLYLSRKIMEVLFTNPIWEQEIMSEEEDGHTSAMPIYPCVEKALELDIGTKYPFYNVEKNIVEYLDFKEHVKKYIHYVKCVRKIKQKYGTIMAW